MIQQSSSLASLIERTTVSFPASMLGGLQLPVTVAPGVLMPLLAAVGNPPPPPYIYIVQTDVNKNKINLCSEKVSW